jgi:hypothetical protein
MRKDAPRTEQERVDLVRVFGNNSRMADEDALTDAELDELEALIAASSPAPWTAFVEGRDMGGGNDFIRLGEPQTDLPDMEIWHEG